MNSRFSMALVLLLQAAAARAETPADFLQQYQQQARQMAPGFTASAERGQQFFRRVGSQDWSCSSCHTINPGDRGKHAVTGKTIDPLAPGANAQRFTRADKVDKWFKRNCNDVMGRPCDAAEKSDLLAYLLSVKK